MAWSFYKTLGYEDKIETAASDLCGFILARKYDEISSREISQKVLPLRNKMPKIRATMQLLEAYNWVRVKKWVNNKPTWWDVNPEVHKCFAERAETERKERERKRKLILEAVGAFTERKEDENISLEHTKERK